MGVGNNEMVIHQENCDSCIAYQEVIDFIDTSVEECGGKEKLVCEGCRVKGKIAEKIYEDMDTCFWDSNCDYPEEEVYEETRCV